MEVGARYVFCIEVPILANAQKTRKKMAGRKYGANWEKVRRGLEVPTEGTFSLLGAERRSARSGLAARLLQSS